MNALEWLIELISFDTTSRNSNLSLIEYLANGFIDHHIDPILIYDPKEPKANLLATIPAHNGCMDGGIIFSGHTDVVPIDGQIWESNPFQALVKNDRVYGRGACDMKGFIAVVMSLLPQLKSLNLNFPIHFAFSYDEEIGCLGAPYLIDKMSALNYTPKACIVGEPTMMHPVIGHKGIQSYRCTIQGLAAHSSLTPEGCNAIEYAAPFIIYLRKIADRFKSQGTRDELYDVPYTTLSTNLIHGGNAHNTIPSLCEIIFELRNLANDNPDEIHQQIIDYINNQLLPSMHKEQANTKITLENIAKVPGLETLVTEPLVRIAQSICHNHEVFKVAYATEAGLFQKAKIPTIVCGPGNIEQAHRANEFVSMAQLNLCKQFVIDILKYSFNQ